MKPITIKTFCSLLGDWVSSKAIQINNYVQPFYSQGGWEGWVQVELAMLLTESSYDVIRERAIYNNSGQRADLVINSTCSNASYPPIVVEIKCQSIFLTDDDFYKAICADEQKLKNLPVKYKKLMIVFVVDQGIYDRLLKSDYYDVKNGNSNFTVLSKIL